MPVKKPLPLSSLRPVLAMRKSRKMSSDHSRVVATRVTNTLSKGSTSEMTFK